MRLPLMKTLVWRSATLLLISIMVLACSLLPWSAKTSPPITPNQPTEKATVASEQSTETTKPTDEPASQAGATAPPTAGPYSLAISDRYPFFVAKHTIALSLAAKDGAVWIGTVSGTIEKVDAQTGTFGQSISFTPDSGGSMPTLFPFMKMAFEGKYLWAFANYYEAGNAPPSLFALDPESGKIIQQWDLNSPEWTQGYERMQPSEEFGVSPGKIWIDSHIVDTQTFEVAKVPMPGITYFAYGGNDWMWITGELGGACDDMILINVDDPSMGWCPDEWPFLIHTPDGVSAVNPGSPMVLTGDRMWIAGSWSAESLGDSASYTLDAYPADLDQAMKETGPLASVSLLDSDSSVMMLFAGDYLWLVYTGDKAGWLYQLDPQTGATINSLDLVGDQGRAISDVPQDIATEGDNLWVLTSRQLLRIKLP